jgi:hypothetical protein
MNTLLVTVMGPGRAFDLELPAETAISELLPALLEVCGLQPLRASVPDAFLWNVWGLRPTGGQQILQPNLSLAQAGILDGALLELQDLEALRHARPPIGFTPRNVQPQPGGIGVTWGSEPLL